MHPSHMYTNSTDDGATVSALHGLCGTAGATSDKVLGDSRVTHTMSVFGSHVVIWVLRGACVVRLVASFSVFLLAYFGTH